MSETTEPNVGTFTLTGPLTTAPAEPVEVPDHAEWPLPNGFAWVFPADGNTTGSVVRPVTLRGPGIKDQFSAELPLPGGDFIEQWAENRARFPRGVDLLLVRDGTVVGLPRTTRISEA